MGLVVQFELANQFLALLAVHFPVYALVVLMELQILPQHLLYAHHTLDQFKRTCFFMSVNFGEYDLFAALLVGALDVSFFALVENMFLHALIGDELPAAIGAVEPEQLQVLPVQFVDFPDLGEAGAALL